MPSDLTIPETQRRQAMWENLTARGGPTNVVPGLLRELGIYGGAQGIWVNKEITGSQSLDGAGVAVGVLHNGSSYDDDLSDEGVIYHFPNTRRSAGRDTSETAALRNALSLNVPIFVITHSPSSNARRDVHLGWVVDIDDAAALCLIEFGDARRSANSASAVGAGEFRLEANRTEISQLARRLKRTPRFAFEVGKRCGWRCAVCSMELKSLLDAAHVRGVAEKGSDDPRNGLILCKNHHAAFDARLVGFRPETGEVVLRHGLSADQLGVSVITLSEELQPHIDALRWRWELVNVDTVGPARPVTPRPAAVPR
jgi:putative restriction endonuclease